MRTIGGGKDQCCDCERLKAPDHVALLFREGLDADKSVSDAGTQEGIENGMEVRLKCFSYSGT